MEHIAVVDEIEKCPCSGKSMSNLAAPWILLTLHHHPGTHGYKIRKIIKKYMEGFATEVNITGLHRHLNMLEGRGMLLSEWDTTQKGPPRRRYTLTETGTECVWRWMNTLSNQALLIGRFFDQARSIFPSAGLPKVRI